MLGASPRKMIDSTRAHHRPEIEAQRGRERAERRAEIGIGRIGEQAGHQSRKDIDLRRLDAEHRCRIDPHLVQRERQGEQRAGGGEHADPRQKAYPGTDAVLHHGVAGPRQHRAKHQQVADRDAMRARGVPPGDDEHGAGQRNRHADHLPPIDGFEPAHQREEQHRQRRHRHDQRQIDRRGRGARQINRPAADEHAEEAGRRNAEPCLRSRPGCWRSAATISGERPIATIDQRKKAIENGGTEPATPRAKIMLETCAVDSTRKPSRPSVSRVLPVIFAGSLMSAPYVRVMAGHSRLKDGVASARLCPAIHVLLLAPPRRGCPGSSSGMTAERTRAPSPTPRKTPSRCRPADGCRAGRPRCHCNALARRSAWRGGRPAPAPARDRWHWPASPPK